MRVCIAGGGIAGTLLAWRLAQRADVEHVELLLGEHARADATGRSGGVVRAYEPDPRARRLAIDSLDELLSSPVLRVWSDYRETGAAYLRAGDGLLAGELREIDERLPGSARYVRHGELAQLGWHGLAPGTIAVVERRAGHIDAERLRTLLALDLAARANVSVVRAAAGSFAVRADGTVATTAGGRQRIADAAVVAAGAWTPGLLVASGLPCDGLRTKAIQCTTYTVAGRRPLPFADETSGLYGKPVGASMLLLGLATQQWDVAPGRRPPSGELRRAAARVAAKRVPWLRLGRAQATVSATDCYGDPPILRLCPVAGANGAVWTFTSGSGGSVKTALAASRHAADRLLRTPVLEPSIYGG